MNSAVCRLWHQLSSSDRLFLCRSHDLVPWKNLVRRIGVRRLEETLSWHQRSPGHCLWCVQLRREDFLLLLLWFCTSNNQPCCFLTPVITSVGSRWTTSASVWVQTTAKLKLTLPAERPLREKEENVPWWWSCQVCGARACAVCPAGPTTFSRSNSTVICLSPQEWELSRSRRVNTN